METSKLDDEIFRAHITTPNSQLSQTANSWEGYVEEIAKRTSQYFSRKMQGNMVPEQKALLDKINQRVNLIATYSFYPENNPAGKKNRSAGSKGPTARGQLSHLNLLTENECRIQVFQQLLVLFYNKIIYALKKILWSFHKKLQPVVVFQQATAPGGQANQSGSDKCTLFIREYEPNKAFYKAFFVKLVATYQHCRAKYRDFRAIQVNLQRHLQTCLARHKQLATNAI